MKLFVARHGQTNYNELGLCNSDPKVDVHITKVGIDQANRLAYELKDKRIQHVFVSELKRTQQTAKIVNKFHNSPTTIDARLNDIRFGYEGMPYRDYHAALDATDDKFLAKFNGGESIRDLRDWAQSFIDELKGKGYQEVLVVTSGGVMQAIYGILGNHSVEEAWSFRPDKGSCLEFDI